MRLVQKLNTLALMTAMVLGTTAFGCGDDEGTNSTNDGGPDATTGGDSGTKAETGPGDSAVEKETGTNGSCEVGGESFSYFIGALDIGQEAVADSGEIAGLDVDGVDNTDSTKAFTSGPDGEPCHERPDFKLPGSPGVQGIDNSIGKLISDLGEQLPQVDLDLSAEIASSIVSGQLMLAMRIENVDLDAGEFPQNDDCVNAQILRLEVPAGWSEQAMRPMPGQTFTVHPDSYADGFPVVQFLRAKIENGKFVGESSSKLPLEIPSVKSGSPPVILEIVDSAVQFNVDGDSVTGGLLGGKISAVGTVSVGPLHDEITKYDPDMLGPLNVALENVISNYADLSPSVPEIGETCRDISVGMIYSGTGIADLVDPN